MKKMNHSIRPVALLLTLTLLIGSLTIHMPRAAAETTQITTSEKTQSPISNASVSANESESGLSASYGKTPLVFEENRGQTDASVKFLARSGGYALYLTRSEAVFSLQTSASGKQSPAASDLQALSKNKDQRTKTKAPTSDVLRMQFVGANPNASVAGLEEQIGKTNYYTGNNPNNWKSDIPNFARVKYTNIYDGVDLVFYGKERKLEYDFLLAPNADAQTIRLAFDGADKISLDNKGNLIVKTANAEIAQAAPFMYQDIAGQRQKVEGRFVLHGTHEVGFEIGAYDHSKPLVIDPVLTYLTYLGGSDFENVDGIAVDSAGNAYISGATFSTDFPTPNSLTDDNVSAVFVAKLDPTGHSLLYTTFLDGEDLDGIVSFNFGNTGTDIAIDTIGNAYVVGVTASSDFPTTANAYQRRKSICGPIFSCLTENEEGFVTKLDANGQISYSTYLGGRKQDACNAIAVDSAGKAYVTGVTDSGLTFPTKNAFQGTGVFGQDFDPFLTVFNADGSDIIYSTGLGGNSTDVANAIALDSANNAYITGETASNSDFPTKSAFQGRSGGGTDAFVAKFNPSLSGNASLIYSTFLGGSGTDKGSGIAVNSSGQAHVTGLTGSLNFPLKNAIDSVNQINEAFVTVYSSAGSQLNSTFLGGSDQDQGENIALGNGGMIYVTGSTLSSNFPMATPFQATRRGLRDAFVTKLRLVGESPGISSSSFLGGNGDDFGIDIAVRGAHIFVAGNTSSINLQTISPDPRGPVKAISNDSDGFVAKILDTRKDTIGVFNPQLLQFQLRNTLTSGTPNITINRGALGDVPVSGDFNGDGIDTVSNFNNGTWTIRNFNIVSGGYPTSPTTSQFGQAGDLPVVGDWDGNGIDSLGVYRPSTGQFFLSNAIVNPTVNFTITFGVAEDLPVAGDWDADGIDTVGMFRPSVATFFLTNQNVPIPPVNITALFGTAEDLPVTGDWNGDGKDSVGVWRPSVTTFFLSNDNVSLLPSITFGTFGDNPVSGDWDGKP